MAFTNTDTNMTSSTGLAAAPQKYYNRTLLKNMAPRLVHLQFGEVYPMPKNNGTTQNFRKFVPLEGSTTELSEGNPGDSVMLSEVSVEVTLKQYGQYMRTTDKLDLSHFDLNLERKVKMMADAGGLSIDTVVRDELATCTNVLYTGKKTARNTLTAADKLTSTDIRKAVRFLKNKKAETFNGYYIAIVSPDVMFDLQDDEDFKKVSLYQDKENIYSGEVGRLYGVRFIETTQAKVFSGAGASSADVASTIILGKYAYGVTSWTSANPRVIVKPHGSGGTTDPLDQISTVAWKMDGFAAKMLQNDFAIRIESGYSA